MKLLLTWVRCTTYVICIVSSWRRKCTLNIVSSFRLIFPSNFVCFDWLCILFCVTSLLEHNVVLSTKCRFSPKKLKQQNNFLIQIVVTWVLSWGKITKICFGKATCIIININFWNSFFSKLGHLFADSWSSELKSNQKIFLAKIYIWLAVQQCAPKARSC